MVHVFLEAPKFIVLTKLNNLKGIYGWLWSILRSYVGLFSNRWSISLLLSLAFIPAHCRGKQTPVVCISVLAGLENKQLFGRETPLPDVWWWINEKSQDHRGGRQWFLFGRLERVGIFHLPVWVCVRQRLYINNALTCLLSISDPLFSRIRFWI